VEVLISAQFKKHAMRNSKPLNSWRKHQCSSTKTKIMQLQDAFLFQGNIGERYSQKKAGQFLKQIYFLNLFDASMLRICINMWSISRSCCRFSLWSGVAFSANILNLGFNVFWFVNPSDVGGDKGAIKKTDALDYKKTCPIN
jgi:hypothetical protein